jgi:hypothetical protein
MANGERISQLAIPIDIHANIHGNLLQDPRFLAWKQTNRRWQLHVSGGPGSGKVSYLDLSNKSIQSSNQ